MLLHAPDWDSVVGVIGTLLHWLLKKQHKYQRNISCELHRYDDLIFFKVYLTHLHTFAHTTNTRLTRHFRLSKTSMPNKHCPYVENVYVKDNLCRETWTSYTLKYRFHINTLLQT